jgi:hypothetical protein
LEAVEDGVQPLKSCGRLTITGGDHSTKELGPEGNDPIPGSAGRNEEKPHVAD